MESDAGGEGARIACSLTTGADRIRPDREGMTWRVEGRDGLVKITHTHNCQQRLSSRGLTKAAGPATHA